MLLKANILETLTVLSCSGSLICVALNYLTNISPLTGIWFPVYIIFLFILAISFSVKSIQWILHLNKPIKYDLLNITRRYPRIKFILPKSYFEKRIKVYNEDEGYYDTNELSVISTVLERKLVSSWYVPYISEDIGFPFACKQMLDQMIGKGFQICNKIDIKDVYVDVCSVLVNHLKEYRKATKKMEKTSGTIDGHYKKSHPIFDTASTKKDPTAEHCTNILRLILKDLVPWELWDTPHSELLVRILSKRLNDFVETTLCDPNWLNDKLHTVLSHKKDAEREPSTQESSFESMEDPISLEEHSKPILTKADLPDLPTVETTTIESALSTLITKTTAPILQRAIESEFNEDVSANFDSLEDADEVKGTEPVDIQCSPKLRQRRGRQGRNEVKIYDRIIEGSVKTWETDMDLQCISLGQDLLASLDGEITLSRLWEQDANEATEGWSPNMQARNKSPQPLWFGEDDIEIDTNSPQAETSPARKEYSPTRKENSPKPTEALLKDLQSTVSQAKTKIGDLQDEAAGMMEGLLDFGIAGLKKGLRFTGLHDTQDKSPSHGRDRAVERQSPLESDTAKTIEHDVNYTPSTVIQRDEHALTPVPPLMKQSRVSSQDSMARGRPEPYPTSESPEPEYEESADLSTSIARLRTLLQASDGSPPGVGGMGVGGVGGPPRGRAGKAGVRPVDVAAFADEYDMSMDRLSLPEQATNNIQRLDKLLQRTVTGVLNSIKTVATAGPASPPSPPAAPARPAPPHAWLYAPTAPERGVGYAVARAVCARRGAGAVDAALDSLHMRSAPPPPAPHAHDADDLEEWWCGAGARACGAAELARGAGLWAAHVTHRLAALLLADIAETIISAWLEELSCWLRAQVFAAFGEAARAGEGGAGAGGEAAAPREPSPPLSVADTCALLMDRMPWPLHLFGQETLSKAIHFTVSSLCHKDINKDIGFKLLDVAALHFKRSASMRNSSFDVN